MTKKSDSNPIEQPESEISGENSPVVDDLEDSTVSDEMVVQEEVAPVKKKTVSRKKTADAAAVKVPKVKKTPAKRSRTTKIGNAEKLSNAPVMKAFWGVFNPMMVQVAQYNYADEADARKTAADMSEKKKAPHFVQLIKKVL